MVENCSETPEEVLTKEACSSEGESRLRKQDKLIQARKEMHPSKSLNQLKTLPISHSRLAQVRSWKDVF